MPVIGTAGHVDHGKTALISALTGIDTDRLPEEKARGMTTDLGFAHYKGEGMTVGVIDVPGHERYIRNMVAGACGLDGALLVVAADDGWMEQTGRHVEVLRALGVPILVLVMTKAALVPPERPIRVAEAVLSRLAAHGDPGPTDPPPWIAVDSIHGTGLEGLRALVAMRLRALPPSRLGPGLPHLFVDRAFPLAGTGQVVAGSLRGGALSEGDELVVTRTGEAIRIRGLQRYGEESARAEAGSRVAITFAKAREGVVRGDSLSLAKAGFFQGGSFYLSLHPSQVGWKPRAGLSVEACAGTAHGDAIVWPAKVAGFVRVAAVGGFSLSLDQPVLLLRKGGADILASGRVFLAGGASPGERRRIDDALSRPGASEPGAQGRACFELAFAGFRELDPGWQAPPGSEVAGAWAFDPRRWASAVGTLTKAAGEPGGFAESGLSSRLGLPKAVALSLLGRLVADGTLKIQEGIVCDGRSGAAPPLSKLARETAERLDRGGREGLDLELERLPGLRLQLEVLSRLGRVKSLDGRLFLSMAAYRGLVSDLLRGRPAGTALSLGEAKEATGLSRKWIIPLLNRMEGDGFVRREGDRRVVLTDGK